MARMSPNQYESRMIARNIAIRHAAAMRPTPTAEAIQRVCHVFDLEISNFDLWMVLVGVHFGGADQDSG